MADTQWVHVPAPFVDTNGSAVSSGNQEADGETAARWIARGAASEIPCKEWAPGIFSKGNVPAWVKQGENVPLPPEPAPAPEPVVDNKKESK